MAAGWSKFTGHSPYPEIGPDGYVPQYGPKQNRGFRLGWIEGKRDLEREHRMMQWMSAATKHPLPADMAEADMADWLGGGEVLCKLVNAIEPGIVPKVHTANEFNAIENLVTFREAALRLGVPQRDVFLPNDLKDARSFHRVVRTIGMLAQIAAERNPNVPRLQ